MASHESPDRPWREILKQMFVCQRIERNGKGTEIGKGRSSHGKLKERLIHFGREPNGYSALAILRYIHPIHSRLHPKTGKTKSTELQNEKYRINKSQQQNEKYKGGAKKIHATSFFYTLVNHWLSIA